MAYKLEYLPSFEHDLMEAEDYLHEFSPVAADKLTTALDDRATTLKEHPFMCPAYLMNEKYRLMILPYQYLCFYYVDEASKTIKVYRLLRGMRDISNLL